MSIWLQKSASIQKRTSHVKFAHLAEKSEKGSISNLSTKVAAAAGDSAEDPTRGAHAIAAGVHILSMAAFYVAMLSVVAACVSWTLPTTLACAVYLSAQYFVIHAYNFAGIVMLGEAESNYDCINFI